MGDIELIVEADGTVTFIHDDDAAGLFEGERAKTRRASHVEPTEDGQWAADLSPVGGPVLGPFRRRGDALAAEVEWLRGRMASGRL